MNSMHDALQAIARSAGLPSLDLNSEGFAEIILGHDLLSIYLHRAEESQLELSARIKAFKGTTDSLARQLLVENGSRELGRFSLLDDGTVVLGHRVELGFETAESLIAVLNRFAREALLLERDGAAALTARAEQHRAPALEFHESFLRL